MLLALSTSTGPCCGGHWTAQRLARALLDQAQALVAASALQTRGPFGERKPNGPRACCSPFPQSPPTLHHARIVRQNLIVPLDDFPSRHVKDQHLFALHHETNLAALEAQCLLTKSLAAPAFEGGDVGVVAGGDFF
jgi:hypothetical protein